MNYYEILEVSPNASQEVLKAAYKSLMQRYHPDKNPNDAEAAAHSVLVVQAFEILSDSDKRAAYDIELKQQLENLNNIRDRVRNAQNSISLNDTERNSHWLLWMLATLIALAIWLVWPPSGNKQSSGTETKEAGLLSKETGALLESYQSSIQQNKTTGSAPSLGTRTIPAFIKDLNINLEATSDSVDAQSNNEKHVLTIRTLGVVVGAFDSDKFISFMEDNKRYISQKLATKLVSAKYETLLKYDGEQYLKQLILDSICEATGTNRLEEYPATGTESPAHYGAIDILLPDSFTVKSLQTVKPKAVEGSSANSTGQKWPEIESLQDGR